MYSLCFLFFVSDIQKVVICYFCRVKILFFDNLNIFFYHIAAWYLANPTYEQAIKTYAQSSETEIYKTCPSQKSTIFST